MNAERRVHLTYAEPSGWTSAPLHFASVEAARAHRDGMNRLAGPDAARRRTWTLAPCDCPEVTR